MPRHTSIFPTSAKLTSMNPFRIAFSGHRPNDQPGRSLAELEATRPLIDKLLTRASEVATSQRRQIQLHSGIAEGSDRIVCEQALSLGIPLVIHLSLGISDFQQDFSSPKTWAQSLAIIEKVRSCHGNGAIRVTPGNHPRPQCYAATNLEMLDLTDCLIVIWDQKPARGKGGTQEAWQLASEKNILKALINPATQEIVINELSATP